MKHNNETEKFYNPRPRKPLSNCHPTIVRDKSLMTDEGEFINELDIADRCKCIHRESCRDLLLALRL